MISQKIALKIKNKKQANYLDKRIEFARRSYNAMLGNYNDSFKFWKSLSEEEKQQNKESKPTIRKIRDKQKLNKIVGFEDCSNMIVETESEHLDFAFKMFFENICKYPKFKKYGSKHSFSINRKNKSTCRIDDNNKIHLSKDCIIKLSETIKYQNPKSYTFSKQGNKYFVSIIFDDNPSTPTKTGINCGIDIGLKNTVSMYDSNSRSLQISMDYNKLSKDYKKVDDYTRILSRKKKGSKRYAKFKLKRQLQLTKIKNKQNDFNNKTASYICNRYDEIGLEDLNINGMHKNRKLSHSLQIKAIGVFLNCLITKANITDKRIIKIDRFFPSSQICSNCGQIHREMKDLSLRTFICDCGCNLDRDINAAKNILIESQRIRVRI